MDVIFTTDDVDRLAEMCEHKIGIEEEGLVVFRPSEVCALTTFSDPANEDFMRSRGLKARKLGNAGGCIVAFPGNVEVGHFSKDLDNHFVEMMTEEALAFLKMKGLDVVRDNNDLLADGQHKVFSTSRATYNERIVFSAIHISINCDADLVRKICTKEMKKVPKGLSDYGITTEEMLNLVLRVYECSDNPGDLLGSIHSAS